MRGKIVLLVVLILASYGCNKVLMYGYGIRNPKVENKKSLLEYLRSNHLDTSNNYALKDTAALMEYLRSGIGAPEILFYDRNGFLMKYRDDKKCNGQNDSLISFLDPKHVIGVDSTRNIHAYLNQLRTLDGDVVELSEFNNMDYYLIIYWAKWLGKMNENKITEWEKSIAYKNNLKIKAIKLSTDYMNFWEIDKNEMIKIYSPKIKAREKKR